jgi:hypothetical protein
MQSNPLLSTARGQSLKYKFIDTSFSSKAKNPVNRDKTLYNNPEEIKL